MKDYEMTPLKPPKEFRKTNEFIYVGVDGYSIEQENGKYILSFADSGHGGRLIKIEVLEEDDDFARLYNPSFEQIIKRLSFLGRLKEI